LDSRDIANKKTANRIFIQLQQAIEHKPSFHSSLNLDKLLSLARA
jgi:hypothetical protein